jgi:DNA replication licensing factor MCM3
MDLERDANFLQTKQDFAYFLAPDHGQSVYANQISEMLGDGLSRLKVDLNDIAQYDPELRRNILAKPMDFLPAWEEALKEFVHHNDFAEDVDPDLKAQAKQKSATLDTQFKIGLHGNFGPNRITPQRLLSNSIGKMICVEGIVTRTSLIRPKVECLRFVFLYYIYQTANAKTQIKINPNKNQRC